MKLKLYLLTRKDHHPIYDCVDGSVIAAESEEQARRLAPCGDEGPEPAAENINNAGCNSA